MDFNIHLDVVKERNDLKKRLEAALDNVAMLRSALVAIASVARLDCDDCQVSENIAREALGE